MSVFLKHLFLDKYRQHLFKKYKLTGQVKKYLSMPLVKKQELIKNIEFVVLDFETTGLDVNKDKIVSMGWTIIKNLHLSASGSKHFLVKPKLLLDEQNVGIHQLTDDEVSKGLTISKMMDNLLQIIAGRVLIVHFDKIERGFINIVCKQLYGFDSLPMRMLDTLKIESSRRFAPCDYIDTNSLRLFNLRKKYNLPRYKAHNATQDAISTAEVFLAQISYIGNVDKIKLKDLIV